MNAELTAAIGRVRDAALTLQKEHLEKASLYHPKRESEAFEVASAKANAFMRFERMANTLYVLASNGKHDRMVEYLGHCLNSLRVTMETDTPGKIAYAEARQQQLEALQEIASQL